MRCYVVIATRAAHYVDADARRFFARRDADLRVPFISPPDKSAADYFFFFYAPPLRLRVFAPPIEYMPWHAAALLAAR